MTRMPIILNCYVGDEIDGHYYERSLSYAYTFNPKKQDCGGFDVRGLAELLGLIPACSEANPKIWHCHAYASYELNEYFKKTGENHFDIIRKAFEAGLISEND